MLTDDLTATAFLCHRTFRGPISTCAGILYLFSLVCQRRESIICNQMSQITIAVIANYSHLFIDIAQAYD